MEPNLFETLSSSDQRNKTLRQLWIPLNALLMQTAPFMQPISYLSQQGRDFQELGLLSGERRFFSYKNFTLPI
jgi:hypothetical protein